MRINLNTTIVFQREQARKLKSNEGVSSRGEFLRKLLKDNAFSLKTEKKEIYSIHLKKYFFFTF